MWFNHIYQNMVLIKINHAHKIITTAQLITYCVTDLQVWVWIPSITVVRVISLSIMSQVWLVLRWVGLVGYNPPPLTLNASTFNVSESSWCLSIFNEIYLLKKLFVTFFHRSCRSECKWHRFFSEMDLFKHLSYHPGFIFITASMTGAERNPSCTLLNNVYTVLLIRIEWHVYCLNL